MGLIVPTRAHAGRGCTLPSITTICSPETLATPPPPPRHYQFSTKSPPFPDNLKWFFLSFSPHSFFPLPFEVLPLIYYQLFLLLQYSSERERERKEIVVKENWDQREKWDNLGSVTKACEGDQKDLGAMLLGDDTIAELKVDRRPSSGSSPSKEAMYSTLLTHQQITLIFKVQDGLP